MTLFVFSVLPIKRFKIQIGSSALRKIKNAWNSKTQICINFKHPLQVGSAIKKTSLLIQSENVDGDSV